ncbi:MAG TPA: hypothetical protein DCM28_06120 [Phycisphaerales bacterium]|nr:hypothetical protein [Phycisphaerales bacterium]|tara:strand:+ start:52 stop:990 length:939 start_codon:yes stop_codon:yes gene_type:complete
MTTDSVPVQTSLLANLMDLLQSGSVLLLSFEDLSGITYDYPQLALTERLRRHVRPFCEYAKHHVKGSHQCPLNKSLANRAAMDHGNEPLVGCCYLGLTDICRPLLYDGRVMGVFYFGSVIQKGQLQQARQAIGELPTHQSELKTALLRRIIKVPVVTSSQLKQAVEQLEQLIKTVELMLVGLSIPSGLYETHTSNRMAVENTRLFHPLIHRAVRIILEKHDQQLDLSVIASMLRCHPGYLSRLFRKQVGMPVSNYLRQTRIQHACRLLQLGRLDVTAVGLEVGYEDKSNFGRAFRKVMKMSPGQYRQKIVGQ